MNNKELKYRFLIRMNISACYGNTLPINIGYTLPTNIYKYKSLKERYFGFEAYCRLESLQLAIIYRFSLEPLILPSFTDVIRALRLAIYMNSYLKLNYTKK